MELKDIYKIKETSNHVRKINGVDTPVSNPDRSKHNNLG